MAPDTTAGRPLPKRPAGPRSRPAGGVVRKETLPRGSASAEAQSPHRHRSRSRLRPGGLSLVRLLTALLIAVLTATLLGPTAYADPPPPVATSGQPGQPGRSRRRSLADAQRQAAELTEQWHAAKDDLTRKQAEVERSRAAVEPARLAAAEARAAEDRFRVDSDAVIMTAFEHGRLDSLNALLVSDVAAGLPRPDVGPGDRDGRAADGAGAAADAGPDREPGRDGRHRRRRAGPSSPRPRRPG